MNKVIFTPLPPPLDERVTTHIQPGGGVVMSVTTRDGRVVRVCGEPLHERRHYKQREISVTTEMGMVLLFESRR